MACNTRITRFLMEEQLLLDWLNSLLFVKEQERLLEMGICQIGDRTTS